MVDRIRDLLRKPLKDAGLGSTSELQRLLVGWERIVGARIAAQASPLAVKPTRQGKELVLAVPDAVWRQELSLMQREILDRVNEALQAGEIHHLRLVGSRPEAPDVSPFRERPRRLATANAPTEPEAAPASEAVDPGTLPPRLREAFEKLRAARARRLRDDAGDEARKDDAK